MKYYFTAQTHDITSETRKRYREINHLLKARGHINMNYVHMAEDSNEKTKAISYINSEKISHFDYQTKILSDSDAVICDITEHSATVGYQIYYAISKKIPVLALYFAKDDIDRDYTPAVIFTGNNNGLLKLERVRVTDDVVGIVDAFEKDFVQKPFKFNFFIPLNLYNGLNRLAANQGKTKSDLMRGAIEKLINDSTESDGHESNLGL